MQCPYCEAQMMEEQFSDPKRVEGIIWIRSWRCGNCGHTQDPFREANHYSALEQP